eukprot:5452529-Amphidinium_carterae.1
MKPHKHSESANLVSLATLEITDLTSGLVLFACLQINAVDAQGRTAASYARKGHHEERSAVGCHLLGRILKNSVASRDVFREIRE